MFGKTAVADALLGWVLGEVSSGARNKILSKFHGNERPENYEAEIYNVTENTIGNICMIRDKEALPELVEVFLSKILNENTVSTFTIKKSIKLICGDMVIDDEFCEYFRRRLYGEISRNDKLSHWLQLNMITGIASNIGTVLDGVEEVNYKLDKFVDFTSNRNASEIAPTMPKFDDDKQYYIDEKWKSRLFLHTGENDKPLTLENTFIAPDYKCGDIIHYDLEDKLYDFVKHGKGTMIIFGVPGMGKTSITAYLANKYEDNNDVIVLRLKKLSDSIDKEEEIVYSICKELGNCIPFDLRNKVLILDGYDELNYKGDAQKLIKLFISRVNNIIGLKVIVTSRMNYIDIGQLSGLKVETVFLKPYSAEKIRSFYYNILNMSLDEKIEIQIEDVMGIPVILYMALSVGIDITDRLNKYKVYEQVFSLNKGIYDRFRGMSKEGYENGTHMLQIQKEIYHRIMQLLAMEIFDMNKIAIDKERYINIVNNVFFQNRITEQLNEKVIFDFPIKNIYDTSNGIEFIHQSIYEYFVAGYIYQEVVDGFQKTDLRLTAKKLGRVLKSNRISKEIKEFLRYKISNNKKIINNQSFFLEVLNSMLENGMTYYTDECYKEVIICERNIFFNLMEIIHFWYNMRSDIIFINRTESFQLYCQEGINLSNMKLTGIRLSNTNLAQAQLKHTILKKANLENANLREATLKYAILKGANLERTNLAHADLRCVNFEKASLKSSYLVNADLRWAYLKKVNLERADLGYANLEMAHIEDADFTRANLQGVSFVGATLVRINMDGANLEGALFDNTNIEDIKDIFQNQILNVTALNDNIYAVSLCQ